MEEIKENTNVIDKRTFVKAKLNNFILFIKNTFGQNNILLREFGELTDLDKHGCEPFLKNLIQLANFFGLPIVSEINKKKVEQFLQVRGLLAKEADIVKMLRYLDMFLQVI